MIAKTEGCTNTLTWTPINGETGLAWPERTEACDKSAGHTGFHHGPGGNFGPVVPLAQPQSPPPASTAQPAPPTHTTATTARDETTA